MRSANPDSSTPSVPTPDPEQSFTWDESPAGLCIRLPAPPPEPKSVGCALAVLITAALLLFPLVIVAIWYLCTELSGANLLILAIVLIVAYAAMRYLLANVRAERTPSPPAHPVVLTIHDGILKVERAGPREDTDITWNLTEVADIRFCPTHEHPLIPGPSSLLKAALSPPEEDLVRISVMHPTGEVDDITIRAPGRQWIDDLEHRLRTYLHISPDALLTYTLDTIAAERPNPDRSFKLAGRVLDQFGETDLAQRLYEATPADRSFLDLADLLNILAWETSDNGHAIHRAAERWLRECSSLRAVQIALNLEVYLFPTHSEMETALKTVATRFPEVAARCQDLIQSRRRENV